MLHPFHILDVFTEARFGGNQLAVLPDAAGLAAQTMQAIAAEFGFSEMTFVLPAEDARHDCRVRIFTPRAEIGFAGHPTIGSALLLARLGRVQRDDARGRVVMGERAGEGILVFCRVANDPRHDIRARMFAPAHGIAEHGDRLLRSCAVMDLPCPFAARSLDRAVLDVLAANRLGDAYVRRLVWRGSEALAVGAPSNRAHVAIAAWPWAGTEGRARRGEGLRLTVADWRRPPPERLPHEAEVAAAYAIGTLSRLDEITRRIVLHLARARGLAVVARAVLPDELARCDEMILVGTAAEVVPVCSIDAVRFRGGPAATALADAYAAHVRGTPLATAV
jgi:branched-chain amino acid aminotransferase